MSVVYDAGALIALDRGDRAAWARHRERLHASTAVLVTSPVVAQVSRDARQVHLRRALAGCTIVPFAATDAHDVGRLLGAAGTSDVVDAHLVMVAARTGSVVRTSDPSDIAHLGAHLRPAVTVLPV